MFTPCWAELEPLGRQQLAGKWSPQCLLPPDPPRYYGKPPGGRLLRGAWRGAAGRAAGAVSLPQSSHTAPTRVFSPQSSTHGTFGSGSPMAAARGEGLPGPPLLPALLAALALLGLLVYVGALCAACRRYALLPRRWGCFLGLLSPPWTLLWLWLPDEGGVLHPKEPVRG